MLSKTMKGILLILDGIGDLPNSLLAGKTPLEVADTPNLDFFASKSELGMMWPVRKEFIPESDEAVVSIFGNELISSTRGQLEARGAGIKLMRGDLALRVNFATIDSLDKGNIIDRRAGRTLTTEDAEILTKALAKGIKSPIKFEFKPTVQHRAALVFRGGFSENISGNDFPHVQGEEKIFGKINLCEPLDDDENSQYTSNIVNEFIEKTYQILNNHPVNNERRKKGLMPANYLLIRGAGIEPPKLKQYKKWLSVCYMPLEIGFAEVSGMTNFSFPYPKLKSFDSYENLHEGLREACDFSIKTLKANTKKFNYAYIHIKETDVPGHDNKPLEKKLMLEEIDRSLIKFLREFAQQNNVKIVITGDHSTPCKLKSHSADLVPVLLFDPANEPSLGKSPLKKPSGKDEKNLREENSEETKRKFCEREAINGSLGKFNGKELLEKVGFVR